LSVHALALKSYTALFAVRHLRRCLFNGYETFARLRNLPPRKAFGKAEAIAERTRVPSVLEVTDSRPSLTNRIDADARKRRYFSDLQSSPFIK